MIKAGYIGFLRGGDPIENLKAAAAIGYKAVDGDASRIPGEGTLAEKAQMMRDIGIEPLTCAIGFSKNGIDIPSTKDTYAEAIERAHAQGIKRITLFGGSAIKSFNGPAGTYEELMADIDALNFIIPKFAEEGLYVAYHNHYQEFFDYHNAVHPIDIMLKNTDPRLTLELDVGWVTVAGMDPVEVMRRMEGRIGAMHLKDIWDLEGAKHLSGYKEGEVSCFTALGTGELDYVAVLKEMERQGLDCAIVEQDRMRYLSPLDSLKTAYLNMKETGLVE